MNDRRTGCFACKNVKYDDECITECPNKYLNNNGICMKDPKYETTSSPE